MLLLCAFVAFLLAPANTDSVVLSGQIVDAQSSPIAHASISVLQEGVVSLSVESDQSGRYRIAVPVESQIVIRLQAAGFTPVEQRVTLHSPVTVLDLRLTSLSAQSTAITVNSSVREATALAPDPSQRIYIRDETLDANPGRPGPPISIPGLPQETASGGIKAPQYFAPGVAGDHGEPIAQYLQVGSYLVPNNLSANAHGNGYADPNFLIPATLEAVAVDSGAFNVREGNHAVNLALQYMLRQRFAPFFSLATNGHDIDGSGGWAPSDPNDRFWVAIEAAYGNGLLRRLEHRQQYKLSVWRQLQLSRQLLTIFATGYYGFSYLPGLTPLDAPQLPDTIDNRQRDQTHTGMVAANDRYSLRNSGELQLSGFFRTYNLSLLSNFGDGLIRQSEFRTVNGGNATYYKSFGRLLSILSGFDYSRDAPRRLNLDRMQNDDFAPVTSNNLTISGYAPFLAIDGSISKWAHYNLGWRHDELVFHNSDLLNPTNSYVTSTGVESPKATFSFLPEGHPLLPSVSASFGQAFLTNDPRIGLGTDRTSPVSRLHSYQLVALKRIWNVEWRATLGQVTSEATFAKLDADTGLNEYQGPGRNRYITASARRYFRFGLLQGSLSKADARDTLEGQPIPEAPRTIVDVLATVNTLPWGLQARAEYERVGVRPLGDGFRSVPITEFRGALLRQFAAGRMDLALNFLLATGYTGQTVQSYALPGEDEPFHRVFGVRLPSSVGVAWTYRLAK